jgi:hypothetical protein
MPRILEELEQGMLACWHEIIRRHEPVTIRDEVGNQSAANACLDRNDADWGSTRG